MAELGKLIRNFTFRDFGVEVVEAQIPAASYDWVRGWCISLSSDRIWGAGETNKTWGGRSQIVLVH